MAIAPWSWNASNGSATAAQTQAAYNALIGKDYTSKFSYKVWNDLVNKVYEVNRAMNRSWKTDYATLAATRASRVYDELTDARFNSIRFNTNYPSWRWNYDADYEGYIGRTDVRGVASYGDAGADIVYGVYLLELVDKLNVVIGIINGTQDVEEAQALLPMILLPEPELVLPHSAKFDRLRHREIISPHALLKAENLPTLTLHFVIRTAGFRAVLESENISSMLEGFAYISTRIDGRLERLPPVSLSQVIRSRSEAQALLKRLSPYIIEASSAADLTPSSKLNRLHSDAITAESDNRIGSSADGTAKASKSIGWHHIRVMLEPEAGLTQEIKKILEAVGVQRIGSRAGIMKAPSASGLMHGSLIGSLGHGAEFAQGVPHLMQIHHAVSSVEADGDLRLVQFMESLNAETTLSGPSSRARLEYDHISTMLRAYLSSVLTGRGEMDKQITGPMDAPVDIAVTVPAEAVADYAPNMVWAIEMMLSAHGEAHTAIAGHGIYQERIAVVPSALANTGFASSFDSIRQENILSMLGTLTRESHGVTIAAIGRYGHSSTGEMIQSSSRLMECGMPIMLPRAFGSLDSEIILATEANASIEHQVPALLDYLTELRAFQASETFSVISQSGLDHIIYADLASVMRAILTIAGDMESEGGRWQYPVIVDTDATIFQVWLTEQNREHLFLDPHNGIYHAEIRTDINGMIDRQIRIGMASESNHHVSVYGTLQKRRRGDWEYPVLEDGVLLITQAIDTQPNYQYNLEVR